MNTFHTQLTRRHFIAASAGAIAAGLMPVRVVLGGEGDSTPRPRSEALYGLALLGDLHYDQFEHHDMDWVKAEKPRDIRQIEGYVESTNTHMPRLFKRVGETIKASPVPIAAALHVGDFVEGLCGSYDLQSLQSRDAIAFVEGSELGVPFIMVKGNHDITGPGSDESFNDVLLPWMARNTGADLSSANFTWQHGEDVYVCFDAYKPDLAWLNGQSELAKSARHVFFMVHPPVVPYNARANWHVFSHDDQAADRAGLIAWLGKHKARVLSGHLHRYCNLTRSDENGTFTQLAISSVVRNEVESASEKYIRSGVSDYNAGLLDLEPNFSPDSHEDRVRWIEQEKPCIKAFDYARVPGYAMLWVYDDRVEADIYLGYGEEVWKRQTVSANA